jgi:hypothetical protein
MRTEKVRGIPTGACNRLWGVSDKNWVHRNLRAVFLYAATRQQFPQVASDRLPTFGPIHRKTSH